MSIKNKTEKRNVRLAIGLNSSMRMERLIDLLEKHAVKNSDLTEYSLDDLNQNFNCSGPGLSLAEKNCVYEGLLKSPKHGEEIFGEDEALSDHYAEGFLDGDVDDCDDSVLSKDDSDKITLCSSDSELSEHDEQRSTFSPFDLAKHLNPVVKLKRLDPGIVPGVSYILMLKNYEKLVPKMEFVEPRKISRQEIFPIKSGYSYEGDAPSLKHLKLDPPSLPSLTVSAIPSYSMKDLINFT